MDLHASYDPEAKVWYALDCDVPGLVTWGETLERLEERATAVMPELLADNAHLIDPERRRGPHRLRVICVSPAVT